MTTCSRYLSLVGSPRCNLRTGGDGERLRCQLTSAAQSSWEVTKAMKPQTKKGRRAACWNLPRERIWMDPSHIAIRWGKDFAAKGNKGIENRKMQYKHPEKKDLRRGRFDGVIRAAGDPKNIPKIEVWRSSQQSRYWIRWHGIWALLLGAAAMEIA